MSRRLTIFCAVVIAMGLAIPAFAAVQNVKVGGDILITGVARDDFDLIKEGGPALDTDDTVNALISQVRVRIDADLTDNVATTVRLINERTWGQENQNGDDTDIDLDLAFVTLKEMLYSPLTVTLGRQELHFGNDLIIGDPDTNITASAAADLVNNRDLSLRKAFDAIKATLDYNPLVVDIFVAKVDENTLTGAATTSASDDVDLYGVNARYNFADLNAFKNNVGELYFFEKAQLGAAFANKKGNSVRNIGGRISSDVLDNKLNLQLEAAIQTGQYNPAAYNNTPPGDTTRKRFAGALQAIANYKVGDIGNAKDTQLMATYSFYSGERPGEVDGNYSGWEPMYENQTLGDIANALFTPSNSQTITITGSCKPMDDVTAKLTWANLRLLEEYDSASGWASTAQVLNGLSGGTTYFMTKKKDLGNEVDLHLLYDYTEDVQFGLKVGAFLPGTAFDKTHNRHSASQALATCKVVF